MQRTYLGQIRQYIDEIDELRSKRQTDSLSLFEHWTDELELTCQLTTDSKIPSVHLDRDVTKSPAFKPEVNL
jgi:hypothetical protein